MSDIVKKETKEAEKRLKGIYASAEKELEKQLEDLLKSGNAEAAKIEEQYKGGEITKSERQQALLRVLTKIGFWKGAGKAAEKLYAKNREAAEMINARIPAVFADGCNREAWQAEMDVRRDVGLIPLTEEEISDWIEEDPEPFSISHLDEKKDTKWNTKNITVTAIGLLALGIGLDRLAGETAEKVTDRNHDSMIRRAFDVLSGFWGGGKDAMASEEEKKGLQPEKEWIATLDFKTRDAHQYLDGKRVPQDEPFVYDGDEIWYPRDPAAPAYLRCNCRCAMRTIRRKYDQPTVRKENLRTPLPDGGWEKKIIPYTDYAHWFEDKRQEYGELEIRRQIKEMQREQRRKYYRKKKRERNAS